MVQRVNIAVPDDLYARYQEVKDSMNMSAVCQSAIQHEIDVINAISKLESDGPWIQRLKREKEDVLDEAHRAGVKSGAESIRDCSFDEIQETLEVIKDLPTESMTGWADDKVSNAVLDRLDWLEDEMTQVREGFPSAVWVWFVGWAEGFTRAWEAVAAKL